MINVVYFYIRTFRSMNAVPNIAVFSSSAGIFWIILKCFIIIIIISSSSSSSSIFISVINLLKPNVNYSGRTAPLTSKHCILYNYSTNIGTVYFTHGIYSPSFSLQNAVCFIILMHLVPVLFTFYIQSVLKFKK